MDAIQAPQLDYPCEMTWDDMEGGDQRVRHCGECTTFVYNLSGMTRKQARKFLREHEGKGRVCVHFVSRDGSIVHSGDPLEQLRDQRIGAEKLLVAALAVHAGLMLVADDYQLDPFEAIQQAFVDSAVEEVDRKFEKAQMSAHAGGMLY